MYKPGDKVEFQMDWQSIYRKGVVESCDGEYTVIKESRGSRAVYHCPTKRVTKTNLV